MAEENGVDVPETPSESCDKAARVKCIEAAESSQVAAAVLWWVGLAFLTTAAAPWLGGLLKPEYALKDNHGGMMALTMLLALIGKGLLGGSFGAGRYARLVLARVGPETTYFRLYKESQKGAAQLAGTLELLRSSLDVAREAEAEKEKARLGLESEVQALRGELYVLTSRVSNPIEMKANWAPEAAARGRSEGAWRGTPG